MSDTGGAASSAAAGQAAGQAAGGESSQESTASQAPESTASKPEVGTEEGGEKPPEPSEKAKETKDAKEKTGEGDEKKPEAEPGEKPAEAKKKEGDDKPPVHKHHERLIKAYPDRKFDNDEAYDTALEEYIGDLEGYKERGVTANSKLISLFESSPEIAEVIKDMISGATFRTALSRHISAEDLVPQEGDSDFQAWEENKQKRIESAKQREAFEKEYAENIEFSNAEIKKFAEENEMDESQTEEFLSRIDPILAEIYKGKVSVETLSLWKKAFNYDDAISKAKDDATIATRNEKIVAEKAEKTNQGDGLPDLKGETPEDKERPIHYLDRVLEHVEQRRELD